jgi:hypothetical protein
MNTMLRTRLTRTFLVLASIGTASAAIALHPAWLPSVNGGAPQQPFSGAGGEQAQVPVAAPQPQPAANPAAIPQSHVGGFGGQQGGAMMAGFGGAGGMMGAMMGPAPAPLKNAPSLADFRDPIPLFRAGPIALLETADGMALAAMNTKTGDGQWKRYAHGAAVMLTPLGSADLVTFLARGENVTEVAAFSGLRGNTEWAAQRLIHPVKEQIAPAIGPGSVLFQEGNNFYAFSALQAKWGVLQLGPEEKARAELHETDITVQQGNRVYVFPLGLAKWSQGIAMKPLSEVGESRQGQGDMMMRMMGAGGAGAGGGIGRKAGADEPESERPR